MVRQVGELHFVQPKLRLGAGCFGRLGQVFVQPEGNVLRHGQMREQRVILKHQPHAAFLRRQVEAFGGIGIAGIADADMPFLQRFEPCQQAQGQAFARAGRANHGNAFGAALTGNIERERVAGAA